MCHDILREDDENITNKQTKLNDNIDEQNGNIETMFSAIKISENENTASAKTNSNNPDSTEDDEENNNVNNNNNKNKNSIGKNNTKGEWLHIL